MKAYTLKKRKDTEECHLFEGDFFLEPCTSNKLSICKKMDNSESQGNAFTCYTEDQARIQIAKIGKQVCGVCTSHLYANYLKD